MLPVHSLIAVVEFAILYFFSLSFLFWKIDTSHLEGSGTISHSMRPPRVGAAGIFPSLDSSTLSSQIFVPFSLYV
jgi:hypothetical protein